MNPDSLHAAIMNIGCLPTLLSDDNRRAYQLGHRDARHAAAELVAAAAPQGAQPAEPVAEGFMTPDGKIVSTSPTLGYLRPCPEDAAAGCKIVPLYAGPQCAEIATLKADAERWRWWQRERIDFCWSPEREGLVKWVRYISMPEPDVSAEGLSKASAVQQLEAFIDGQIASEARVEFTALAASPADAAPVPQARMLTEEETAPILDDIVGNYPSDLAEQIQRRFAEVNGLTIPAKEQPNG